MSMTCICMHAYADICKGSSFVCVLLAESGMVPHRQDDTQTAGRGAPSRRPSMRIICVDKPKDLWAELSACSWQLQIAIHCKGKYVTQPFPALDFITLFYAMLVTPCIQRSQKCLVTCDKDHCPMGPIMPFGNCTWMLLHDGTAMLIINALISLYSISGFGDQTCSVATSFIV